MTDDVRFGLLVELGPPPRHAERELLLGVGGADHLLEVRSASVATVVAVYDRRDAERDRHAPQRLADGRTARHGDGDSRTARHAGNAANARPDTSG